MSESFGCTPENVIQHLNNIYEEEELVKEATTKKFLVVRKEGYAFCPHYNERGEILDSMIGEQISPCLALDNNVAFVDQDVCVSYVTSDNSSKAYVLKYVDGMLNKQEQIVRIL